MSTSSFCPAPMPRWRWRLMHELVANDWLDHDYIAQHTLGLGRPARAGAALDAGARGRGLRRAGGADPRAGARLRHHPARRDPPELRHAARARRRQRRAGDRLPAGADGRLAHRAGGMLLSTSGYFPTDKARCSGPTCWRAARRAPSTWCRSATTCCGRPRRLRPAIEAVVVYNSNPVAVAPESAKVVRGFAREDLFTVVLEQFQTDTADYADYVLPATTQLEHWDVHTAYGHTDVLLNRPGDRARGRGAAEHAGVPRARGAHGLRPSRASRQRRDLCRTAFGDAVDFDSLLEQGFAACRARRALRRGGFPDALGRCEFFSERLARQGWTACPTTCPTTKRPAARRAIRWR
jgi:hypothetical protein